MCISLLHTFESLSLEHAVESVERCRQGKETKAELGVVPREPQKIDRMIRHGIGRIESRLGHSAFFARSAGNRTK